MPTGTVTPITKASQARRRGKPDLAAAHAALAEQDAPPPRAKALLLDATDKRLAARSLSIEQIVPGDNPRVITDADAQRELNASVKERGILDPIRVRPLDNGTYQIVAGWRRWTAAKVNKMETVPVVVASLDDTQSLIDSIVENLQREDLDPIDEATAYKRLIELSAETGTKFTQQRIATLIGKSQPYVANSLRLLNLEPDVLKAVSTGQISVGAAKALVSLPKAQQQKLAKQVVSRKMTAGQVESEAKWERERMASAEKRKAEINDDLQGIIDSIEKARKQKIVGKNTTILMHGKDYPEVLVKAGIKNVRQFTHQTDNPKNGKIECDDDAVLYLPPEDKFVQVCTTPAHHDAVIAEERRKSEEQHQLNITAVNEARLKVRKGLITDTALTEGGTRATLYTLVCTRSSYGGWDRLTQFWKSRETPEAPVTRQFPTQRLWETIRDMPIAEVLDYIGAFVAAETIPNVYHDTARQANEADAVLRSWYVEQFDVDDSIVWGGHQPLVRTASGEAARYDAAFESHEYEPADQDWIDMAIEANDGIALEPDEIPCVVCSYADQQVSKADHDAAMKVLENQPPEADDPDGTETTQPDADGATDPESADEGDDEEEAAE